MTNDRRPSRLPVRGSLALAVTIGGLTLLMGFRSPQDPGTRSSWPWIRARTRAPHLRPAPEPARPRPARGRARPVRAPAPPRAPEPTASALRRAPRPEPTTATLTATGGAYQFRYGIVQVVVTVEGDQIVDVQAVQLPDGDRHSASISQQVEPMLRESALAVDSADIDVVSGATYTSMAYAYSLQSALDQLAG